MRYAKCFVCQATTTLSNSQLMLVDGRSIYLDFFGIVLWAFLPTNLPDVKQIEVIRGPASAVWGANAETGVINIITKSPREAPGTTASISGGIFGRDAGSSEGRGRAAPSAPTPASARIVNDKWSLSPVGRVFRVAGLCATERDDTIITDPRDPSRNGRRRGVSAMAPALSAPLSERTGTSQPKFDARVDQGSPTAACHTPAASPARAASFTLASVPSISSRAHQWLRKDRLQQGRSS
jgi:hypothetical protein